MNILIILPARGGSKGIPRKNLRPLNGKPLISYCIKTALKSIYKPDVYVSTDDDEIAFISKKYLAKVHRRDAALARDTTTLDPVVYQAFKDISEKEAKTYDLVITMQPTSPLLSVHSLDEAIKLVVTNASIDTVIAAVNDTHLSWSYNSEKGYVPNYSKRLNRQHLPQVFKETGSFFISRPSVVTPKTRIGKHVELYQLPASEAIDIDTFQDWSVCEYLLKRKTILFCVSGYPEIGLGHVYNCLILAGEIVEHDLIFLVDDKSELAYEKIKAYNYKVVIQTAANIVEDIKEVKPDIVINDRLDTTIDYVNNLKKEGFRVINFEDLGAGAQKADLVINAIYPKSVQLDNHYFGAQYFCAREEFFLQNRKEIYLEVKNILISFGGTDPNDLTHKVLESVYHYCKTKSIQIVVILGLGYSHDLNQKKYPDIDFYHNVKNISEFMYRADLAFSSAGRTVYELALLGTPSIIMGQNEREMSHLFASEANGFIHLGLGQHVTMASIQQAFTTLCNDQNLRLEMNRRMLNNNIRAGKNNVLKLIRELISQH